MRVQVKIFANDQAKTFKSWEIPQELVSICFFSSGSAMFEDFFE